MSAAPPLFLSEVPPASAVARFAVFGKHPSAADHLADLGLSTPSLAAFKQGFYTDGISTCLARQAWSKQIPAGTIVPYDHFLLALGSGGWMAARFRESSDTSGRNQFPLVTAIHCTSHEALNAATDLWEWLDRAHCRLVEAADLRAIYPEIQADLTAQMSIWQQQPAPAAGALTAWADDETNGPARAGLWRVAHALSPDGAGGSRARVPLPAGDEMLSAVLWASWLRCLLPARPVCLLWKAGGHHADVALTPPDAALLAPLFSPLEEQPLTSAVPFNIAPALVEMTRASLEQWLHSASLFTAALPAPPPKAENLATKMRSWFGR